MQYQLKRLRGRPEARGFTMIIALSLLSIVLAAAVAWLISATHVVAIGTASVGDNSAAQSAIDRLDANVRFATGLAVSANNQILYVTNPSTNIDQPNCTWWYVSGGNLIMQSSSTDLSVIAQGVSVVTFSGTSATTGNTYQGLVSVSFTLNQTGGSTDPSGVTINEALSASNMASAVGTGSCSFSS
jgi:type II secretory pathway pseudopilin PulG